MWTDGSAATEAATAAIRDPEAQLQSSLRDAQIEQGQALRRLNETKANLEKGVATQKDVNEAYADWRDAQSKTTQIQNTIADNAQAAAEAAREDARNAEELRLANNIAAAARTAGTADDKRFYNEAINHYREIARDASRTATEREQARGTMRELREGLRQAVAGFCDR